MERTLGQDGTDPELKELRGRGGVLASVGFSLRSHSDKQRAIAKPSAQLSAGPTPCPSAWPLSNLTKILPCPALEPHPDL